MIPKAELHLHLEGAIFPATVKRLANKHNITLPDSVFGPDNTYVWQDFNDFLNVFELISQVIKTPEDYAEVTYDYLSRSANEGVIYAEIMPSPDHAALAGLGYHDMLDGVTDGIERAKSDHGIECRIVVTAVRHYGMEKCEAVATMVANNPHPLVTGFAIGGDEVNFPPELFQKTYQIAAEANLGLMCHSGEWCGPESIWQAINLLPIHRLGHGVRAIEDLDLIKAIIDRGIALEVAPGSNIALGVFPNYQQHPFLNLKQAGVKVSLNSDDPPFFGTTIGQEYDTAQREFHLSDTEMIDITKMAIQAAFADDELKKQLLAKC